MSLSSTTAPEGSSGDPNAATAESPAFTREMPAEGPLDRVQPVAAGQQPDYSRDNTITAILGLVRSVRLAAERDYYVPESLQYLFPFTSLVLYGPSGNAADVQEFARQDNKEDFQKQNIASFRSGDFWILRGYVDVDAQRVPFLKLSYDGSSDTALARAHSGQGRTMPDRIQVRLALGDAERGLPAREALWTLPYNRETHRYELELWGMSRYDLERHLDVRGKSALERAMIVGAPEMIPGRASDFDREHLNGRRIYDMAADHTMHPVLPLPVTLRWAAGDIVDDNEGAGYRYEFNMLVRGWDHFLGCGLSDNPHGGLGSLEFRNLFSNYFGHKEAHTLKYDELGRPLYPWNFNGDGTKAHTARSREDFLAVEYMDLHSLNPGCSIGVHRHRDNQEAFLVLRGQGLMINGDWLERPDRERAFEVRTLREGHLSLVKSGGLHAFANMTDAPTWLFMFGGYD